MLGDGYTVTVNEITGGTVTLASKDVSDSNFDITVGQQVSLTATPSTGKFVLWTVEGLELTQAERMDPSLVFTMPGNPVTITSAFVSYVPNPVGEVNVNGVIWAMSNTASITTFAATTKTIGNLVAGNGAGNCPTGWSLPTVANMQALALEKNGNVMTGQGLEFVTMNSSEVYASADTIVGSNWIYSTKVATTPGLWFASSINFVPRSDSSLRKQSRCIRYAE